jgi:hypothetical protein
MRVTGDEQHCLEKLMKNTPRILISLVVGLALFAADGFCAEEKAKPGKASNVDVEAAWQRRLPDINLGDNLPLAMVAELIGKQFPELNFVVPVGARDKTVPLLVLRNVTLDDILKAIELASEGNIRGGVPSEPQGVDANGLPIRMTLGNSHGNLVAFSVGPVPGSPSAAGQNPAVCRVFSIAPYLANRSKQDADRAVKILYDAFHTAASMLQRRDSDARELDITIHEGTKLLIAVGRDKDLAVMEQVIKELQRFEPARRITAPTENELKPQAATADPPPAAGTKF